MCWIYKLLKIYWSDCGGQRRGVVSNVTRVWRKGAGSWECGLAVVNKHLIGLLVVLMTGTVIHSGPQRAVSNCLALVSTWFLRLAPFHLGFPGLQGFPLIRLTQKTKKSKCHTYSEQKSQGPLSISEGVHIFLYFSIKTALLCLDLMKNKTEKIFFSFFFFFF